MKIYGNLRKYDKFCEILTKYEANMNINEHLKQTIQAYVNL